MKGRFGTLYKVLVVARWCVHQFTCFWICNQLPPYLGQSTVGLLLIHPAAAHQHCQTTQWLPLCFSFPLSPPLISLFLCLLGIIRIFVCGYFCVWVVGSNMKTTEDKENELWKTEGRGWGVIIWRFSDDWISEVVKLNPHGVMGTTWTLFLGTIC